MPEQVGFIGLGSMGLPIATNLLAGVKGMRVYNRTAAKADPLVHRGAQQVSRPEETASPGAVVISMLADDAAVEEVVIGKDSIADRLAPGGIHVSMSTIAPATVRRIAQYHAERGSTLVSAPVFGRPDAAASRRLFVVTSGPANARKRVVPLLEAIGQKVFDFGDDPGAALVAKLSGNFLIAAAIEAMAETLAMAEKHGVDRTELVELFGTTLFACPVYQGYGRNIAQFHHSPAGFKLNLGLKDMDLVMKTAAEALVPMSIATLLHDRFLSAMAKGREHLDWSAIALGAREDAGLANPKIDAPTS